MTQEKVDHPFGRLVVDMPECFRLYAQLSKENNALLSEVAELRHALEMIVCHGCKNRIGWNETPTQYGDWTKCSSCKQARALLGKER